LSDNALSLTQNGHPSIAIKQDRMSKAIREIEVAPFSSTVNGLATGGLDQAHDLQRMVAITVTWPQPNRTKPHKSWAKTQKPKIGATGGSPIGHETPLTNPTRYCRVRCEHTFG
jgi:hypothetical protein